MKKRILNLILFFCVLISLLVMPFFNVCAETNEVVGVGGKEFLYTIYYGNSLTDQSEVTAISKGAFAGWVYLKSVMIPMNITSIGEYAFFGCPNLKDVYYDGSKEDWNEILIEENNEELINATIHYAKESSEPSNPSEPSEPSVLKGDIFQDGKINSKDAVKLAQYLAKWDITLTEAEKLSADVVADGVINAKDAVKLAQLLAE